MGRVVLLFRTPALFLMAIFIDNGMCGKAHDDAREKYDEMLKSCPSIIYPSIMNVLETDFFTRCMSEKGEDAMNAPAFWENRYDPKALYNLTYHGPEDDNNFPKFRCCQLRYCITVAKMPKVPEKIFDLFRAWQTDNEKILCIKADEKVEGFDEKKMRKLEKIDELCRKKLEGPKSSKEYKGLESCAKEAGLTTPLDLKKDLRMIPHQTVCCMARRCLSDWSRKEYKLDDPSGFPVELPEETQDMINKEWETLAKGETYNCDVKKPLPNAYSDSGTMGMRGDWKVMAFLLMGFIGCALLA